MTEAAGLATEFAGKVALVTGGSRGIGRAVAALLARRGAALVVVGRDAAAAQAAADALAGPAGAIPCAGDAGAPGFAERAVAATLAAFGRLDVLANIAGIFPTARLEDMDDRAFAETMDANLGGTVRFCRAALPALRASGGTIVNMSSMAARFPTPGLAAYGAAKAGVEALTRAVAAEAAPRVRVNAVAAGPTMTDTVRTLLGADATGAAAAVTANLPLGRLAEPEEIAEVVAFLASPRASCITGQVVQANCGGLMA